MGPAPGQHVQLEGSESEGCVDEWGKYDISEQYVDQEQAQWRLLQGMRVPQTDVVIYLHPTTFMDSRQAEQVLVIITPG